ncbi:MAG: glutaredoxin family protein [bacterium]|nr:glutaredoxin family protein [bacterium]
MQPIKKTVSAFAVLVVTAISFLPFAQAQELAGKKEASSEPAYVVVLKNGQRIPSRTKPVNAFGKLRYMDAGGITRVLSVSKVNVGKTQEINANAKAPAHGGTVSFGGSLTNVKPMDTSTQETEEEKKNQTVKVYSATWCPHCKNLRKFLAENGISASITEVDQLSEAEQKRAQAEMKRLTGKVSYPTVVIGRRAVAGFSPGWILKSLGR